MTFDLYHDLKEQDRARDRERATSTYNKLKLCLLREKSLFPAGQEAVGVTPPPNT